MSSNPKKKSNAIRRLYMPNTSPIPNFIFDHMLNDDEIPDYVFRVLFYCFRKTVGWSNRSESITLEQIRQDCAISKKAAHHALLLISDCWGFFKRTPGVGQTKTQIEIASPDEIVFEKYAMRALSLAQMYADGVPSLADLSRRPCSPEVLVKGQELYEIRLKDDRLAEQLKEEFWAAREKPAKPRRMRRTRISSSRGEPQPIFSGSAGEPQFQVSGSIREPQIN